MMGCGGWPHRFASPDDVTRAGKDESPAAPSIYRGIVPAESTTRKDVEGDDLTSLPEGFDFLGMPSNRRSAARSLVEEIAARNSVETFHWYKPSGSNHVVCYWNASDVNLLWITTGHVHIRSNGPVVRPDRRLDWSSADGEFVGWTLPGFVPGEVGTGGSSRHRVDTVPCPHHLAPPQPVGAECPECCVVHEAIGDQP